VASAAACAPLNPAYRESELDFYLTDIGARALLIEEGMASPAREVARRQGIRVLEIVGLPEGAAGLFELRADRVAAEPRREPTPAGDVALVLHTSGTTSRPKLVPLTHASLCASARNVSEVLELTPGDRCLNIMPLFHVHGLVAAVLASLRAGGVTICSPGFDAERFFTWLDELEPTWYTAVPTMHQAIAARAEAHREVVLRRPLRLVRSSSSALPPQVLEALEHGFGCPAIEAYGMTEAAHQIASSPLPPGERKPRSVGLPAGVEVAILGENGSPLPTGAIGEVAIRGPNVFSAYGDNPEANREAFTNGWFRTGDEGSLDADGYLFLHGRLKEIVNRGGEKVSPREVDEVLLDHPAVDQVVTFARPHERLGEEVAVAVVLKEGASATQRAIQEFAASRLADFKVPSAVVFLDQLPRGSTGKVQRIGLAERLGLEARADAAGLPHVEPRTPLERRLAALWADLLRVDRVGVHDDFFDLGGDSITGAALFAQIVEMGLAPADIVASTLLWAPTVGRLAEALEQGGLQPEGSIVPIRPEGSDPPLFFVHGHDGDALGYGGLARRLRSGHRFYGIEARPADQTEPESVTVEGLARQYAGEIRGFQPEGPYLVGGRCMGGGIALEIARVLTGAGAEVALLALLDPIGEPPVGFVRHYWRRFWYHRRRRRVIRAIRRIPAVRAEATRERARRALEETPLQGVMWRASRGYRPTPYGGRITLLRGGYYMTPPSFWKRIAAGGVEAYPPIDQSMIGPPGLDVLAEQLDHALGEAASRSRHG
jgi:acyl-CoA synthetase (AMP-forming)/AMP-acid ligase II